MNYRHYSYWNVGFAFASGLGGGGLASGGARYGLSFVSRGTKRRIGEAFGRLSAITDAFIFLLSPPPIQGLGNSGGWELYIQDQRGRGLDALEMATNEVTATGDNDRPVHVFDPDGRPAGQFRLAVYDVATGRIVRVEDLVAGG